MKKNGFTLIELIIVVIIIGILAAIAAPMMSGMQNKAIAAEAIAALGTIRTAMQQYYAEHGYYPIQSNGFSCLDSITTRTTAVYGTSCLDGTYFSQECYQFANGMDAMDGNPLHYWIICMGPGWSSSNIATKASVVQNWPTTGGTWTQGFIAIRQDGKIYSNYNFLQYPSNVFQ